jgi:2-oxoglutarate ferredoxin oxidoreductase subunit beta
MKSTTTVYSNIEQAFKISELAVAAGASFVARGTVYHANQLLGLMEKGFLKQGFSVVEVISHCQTQYGKLNRMGGAVAMLEWQRDHAVPVEQAAKMSQETLADKFLTGVLVDREMPVYEDEYEKVRARAQEAEGG